MADDTAPIDPMDPLNVVAVTQEKRLAMIANPENFANEMSSEFLKLMADADRTAIQQMRLVQDDKHASEDAAIRRQIADAFVSNVSSGGGGRGPADPNITPPSMEQSINPDLSISEEATAIGHQNVELDDIMSTDD